MHTRSGAGAIHWSPTKLSISAKRILLGPVSCLPRSRHHRYLPLNGNIKSGSRSPLTPTQCRRRPYQCRVNSDYKTESDKIVDSDVELDTRNDLGPLVKNIQPVTGGQVAPSASDLSASDELTQGLVIVILCFLVTVICSVDRAAMSVTLLPMSVLYSWDETLKGSVSSAFFCGYMISQVLGGVLSTTSSPKAVLGFGALAWSICTVATPYAAEKSFLALLLCRFAMGVGEGVALPTIQNIVAEWVAPQQRSKALGTIFSGLQFGTVVALLTAPPLIRNNGWESVFYLYGGLGILWGVLWMLLARDKPQAAISSAPFDSTTAVVQNSSKSSPKLEASAIPWGQFARAWPLYGIASAHIANNVGIFVSIAWLPSYFAQRFELNVDDSANLSIVPWLFTVGCSIFSGFVGDVFVQECQGKSKDILNVRRFMQGVGSIVPAICLLLLARNVQSVLEAEVLFTIALGLQAFGNAGFVSSYQDVAGRYSGIIFGLANTAASATASLGVYATGVVLDATNGSWDAVFIPCAALYLAGYISYYRLATAAQLFD